MLTTLPPSCADYLKIWKSQTPGTLRAVQATTAIAVPLPYQVTGHIYINSTLNLTSLKAETSGTEVHPVPKIW
jgi:hypothetical protein